MKKKSIKALLLFLICITLSVIVSVPTMAAKAKKPKKPKITSVKVISPTAVKISWKKAKNAKKYEIQVSVNGGKFKKLKKLKKRTFKHTNLLEGSTYAYRVRAINGKKKSAFSKIKTVTLGWPDGTELEIMSDSASLPAIVEWTGIPNSKGTLTSVKIKKYHNNNANAKCKIRYDIELYGKEPADKDYGIGVDLVFFKKDDDNGIERYFWYYHNMEKQFDGHNVEYTVDKNGNFKFIWHQKDGDLFAEYDRVSIAEVLIYHSNSLYTMDE